MVITLITGHCKNLSGRLLTGASKADIMPEIEVELSRTKSEVIFGQIFGHEPVYSRISQFAH